MRCTAFAFSHEQYNVVQAVAFPKELDKQLNKLKKWYLKTLTNFKLQTMKTSTSISGTQDKLNFVRPQTQSESDEEKGQVV